LDWAIYKKSETKLSLLNWTFGTRYKAKQKDSKFGGFLSIVQR